MEREREREWKGTRTFGELEGVGADTFVGADGHKTPVFSVLGVRCDERRCARDAEEVALGGGVDAVFRPGKDNQLGQIRWTSPLVHVHRQLAHRQNDGWTNKRPVGTEVTRVVAECSKTWQGR